LGVFPKAECPGIGKFRAKNENQNSPAELAQRYGKARAEIGNDIGKRGRKGWLAAGPERPQQERAAARASEPKEKAPAVGRGLGFVGALFHRLGKLVIGQWNPAAVAQVLQHRPPLLAFPRIKENVQLLFAQREQAQRDQSSV
jgi:hypothetical protein